jgi:hypothetical protein
MDIKTKFSIGDKVWTIIHTKAVELEIYKIVIDVILDNHHFVKYYLRYPYKPGDIITCRIDNETFNETQLFLTKEELINQL